MSKGDGHKALGQISELFKAKKAVVDGKECPTICQVRVAEAVLGLDLPDTYQIQMFIGERYSNVPILSVLQALDTDYFIKNAEERYSLNPVYRDTIDEARRIFSTVPEGQHHSGEEEPDAKRGRHDIPPMPPGLPGMMPPMMHPGMQGYPPMPPGYPPRLPGYPGGSGFGGPRPPMPGYHGKSLFGGVARPSLDQHENHPNPRGDPGRGDFNRGEIPHPPPPRVARFDRRSRSVQIGLRQRGPNNYFHLPEERRSHIPPMPPGLPGMMPPMMHPGMQDPPMPPGYPPRLPGYPGGSGFGGPRPPMPGYHGKSLFGGVARPSLDQHENHPNPRGDPGRGDFNRGEIPHPPPPRVARFDRRSRSVQIGLRQRGPNNYFHLPEERRSHSSPPTTYFTPLEERRVQNLARFFNR